MADGALTPLRPTGGRAGAFRGDVLEGLHLLWKLPAFLRRRLTPERARDVLRRRLAERGTDFLTLARTAIYGNPASPYRQLLAAAGCEYGDLERMVGEHGVEGTLRVLLRHGVYLTIDEFKGRRPVVRGGTTIAVDPPRLRNPGSAAHLWSQTSGSRGARTPVPIDLRFVEDAAVNVLLALVARGALDWHLGYWDVPGGTLRPLLTNAKGGALVRRWFSPVDPAAPDLHARYRWSGRLIRMAGQLAGVPFPRPEHVPIDDPLPIARWMAHELSGGTV
ncbi:MAG: hypothetical protein ACREJR_02110, partial [Candidatus Rokuibacteriota bacterium]